MCEEMSQEVKNTITIGQKPDLEQKILQSTNLELIKEMEELEKTNMFFEIDHGNSVPTERLKEPEIPQPDSFIKDDGVYCPSNSKRALKDNYWNVTTEDTQFVTFTANNQDMYSQLQKQAIEFHYSNKQEFSVVIILIINLDEHGFLSGPINFDESDKENLIPEIHDVDFEYVRANIDKINKYIAFEIKWDDLSRDLQQAFAKLRLLKPNGVGLRSQKEYFINMAKDCERFPEWAMDIFKNHWEQLLESNGDLSSITCDMGKTEDEIKAAFQTLPRFHIHPSDYFVPSEYKDGYDLEIFPNGDGTFSARLTCIPSVSFDSSSLDIILSTTNEPEQSEENFKEDEEPELNLDVEDNDEDKTKLKHDNKDNDKNKAKLKHDNEDNDGNEAKLNLDIEDSDENENINEEKQDSISTIKHKISEVAKKERKEKNGKDAERIRNDGYNALSFIQYLNYRQKLLLDIGNYIAEKEEDFLNGKTPLPTPLEQKECAVAKHRDPARISNVLKGKLVRITTPAQKTYTQSLRYFFSNNTDAAIQEIIDAEDKQHPLSDNKISQELKDEYNITLDRSGISRLRKGMGIPNKSERKIK